MQNKENIYNEISNTFRNFRLLKVLILILELRSYQKV